MGRARYLVLQHWQCLGMVVCMGQHCSRTHSHVGSNPHGQPTSSSHRQAALAHHGPLSPAFFPTSKASQRFLYFFLLPSFTLK